MPKTLNTIKEIADIVHKPYADREEVAKMLTSMLTSVSKVIKELRAEIKADKIVAHSELKNSISLLQNTILGVSTLVEANRDELKSQVEKKIKEVRRELELIASIIPEERDLTYLELAISNLKTLVSDATTPEQVRDKLEKLKGSERLGVDAIDGLVELLEKYKKSSKGTGGGGGMLSIGHWPRHESFTMNGSDTTATLTQGVAANGTAIIVRYQGQTLDMDTHYTVSGNKITLVGFTPEADTIISVTYWT